MTDIQEAYLAERAELGKQCLALLDGFPDPRHILSHVFWENLWCGADGVPHALYYEEKPAMRRNVQSFGPLKAPAIETVGGFQRLCVTTNWVLDLRDFSDYETWFRALSENSRKRLRRVHNGLTKAGAVIVPIHDEESFRKFEALYSEQFPKHPAGSADNRGVWTIYRELEKQGRNFSFLMLDADGNPVAANLGFIHGKSFCFTHLTRRKGGPLDRFSPGFYLTCRLVDMLYRTRPEVKFFFLGPGKYDYKPAMLAKPLPVYRCERNSLWNLAGLLRLRHRLARERRLFAQEEQ